MHSRIDDIIDVNSDDHYGCRVATHHLGKSQESHILIRMTLIRKLAMFKSDYLNVFGCKECLKYIHDSLFPPNIMPKNDMALVDKWFTFPDMGHILAINL
jgi:hypothetical protein